MHLEAAALCSRFYYIRHGRTPANEQGLMCGGSWDIELSEEGIRQAEEAAGLLAAYENKFSRIVHSPLQRARRTAEVINQKLNLPLTEIEDLAEWRFGSWERIPYETVKDAFWGDVDPVGGETREEFRERTGRALLKSLQAPGPVLIVAHGAVWFMISQLLKIPPMKLMNCQPLRVVHKNGVWIVEDL